MGPKDHRRLRFSEQYSTRPQSQFHILCHVKGDPWMAQIVGGNPFVARYPRVIEN
jgi:hypothetical protein